MDRTELNSKCSLCGKRDETISHIISECSKLAQKECKTRHYFVGKVFHGELGKHWNLTILRNSICQSRICPREWDRQNSSRFQDTDWSPNPGQNIISNNNLPRSELGVYLIFLSQQTTEWKSKKTKKKKKKKQLPRTCQRAKQIITGR